MPIHGCSRDGKKGFRWGSRGRCYVGKGAKAKAAAQAAAAFAHGYRGKSCGGPACACDDCGGHAALYTYRASAGLFGLAHLNRKADVKHDDDEMSASAVLASSRRDRQGDIIECAGVDFEDHRWNPVVMWDHGRQVTIPIGLTETPRGEYTVAYREDGDLIVQKTYFAPTKFARQVYALVRGGFIRACSIAVKDLEVEKLPPDPEEGHFKPGKHIIRSSLAEVTWTPLPANPDAVRSLLASRRLDCGGFGNEQLDGVLCKSFLPYLPPAKARSGGVTLKSGTGGGAKPMSDELELTRRDADGGDYEDEVADDTDYKGDAPPGSQALHEMHDAYKSVKDVLSAHHGRQEHPKVAKIVANHLGDVEDTLASLRDAHEQIYPDHEAPADDAMDAKDDVGRGPEELATTPDSAGEGGLGEDVEGGGDRVEEEERRPVRRRAARPAPKKVPASRKSYDPGLEALRRTVARKREREAELMEDFVSGL